MIKMTVKKFLRDEIPEWPRDCYIYIVRDVETVFYVGYTSRNVLTRLWEHFTPDYPTYGGEFWRGPSLLGRFVEDNFSTSLEWEVQLLTIKDALDLLGHTDGVLNEDVPELVAHYLEADLIHNLRPCLNGSHNSKATPIPSHYIDPREKNRERMRKAHKEMFG